MGSILRKALTSVETADLRSEDLDPILHEELVEKQPLLELFNLSRADGKTHEFRKVTSHPKGWFEGEETPANSREGSYSRESVQLKILRNWGSVTGFNQAVTEKDLDSLATEIDLSLQGVGDIIEWSTLFGASGDLDSYTGDSLIYSGILPVVYGGASDVNVIDGAGAKISLDKLDDMMEAIDYRGTDGDPKFFAMSGAMKNVVNGLQTKVQMNIESAELFDGKLVMSTYDSKPIYKTNMLKPGTDGVTSLAVADGSAGGTGSLGASTYGYRVSSVTFNGEHVAVSEVTNSPADDDLEQDLTWTADADAYLYMIWRSNDNGTTYGLRDIIAAKTYDSNNTVNGTVAAWTDTDFSSGSHNTNIQPLETGEQIVTLFNASPRNGASYLGMVDGMGQALDSMVSYVPLARTKDTYDFMLKSYLAMKIVNPDLFAVLRNVKTTA